MNNNKIKEVAQQLTNCANVLGELCSGQNQSVVSTQNNQTSAQNLDSDELAVVAVKKAGYNRDIVAFKLNNGQVLNYEECLQAVSQGMIPSLNIGADREGKPTIRGVADGNPSNNLQSLPEF